MMAPMDLGISGRLAVVTGGGRGIGAAVVERLRGEGATVVDASRSTGVDVTSPEAPARIAELAGGPVDILVNNAGTSFARSLDELTDEDWHGQWELHVIGPMRLMRAFAPEMAERGWGRIVNVASSAGKRPSLTNAAYSVTKAAEIMLSRVFADTYAGTGVLVNAVAPGAVASPLWMAPGGLGDQTAAAKGLDHEGALQAQRDRVPMGRFGTPGEIADVIAFLCSERASVVLGAAWSVDGGTVPF
jgi:3-oxoacyl-[acyl-carrier protein] reductase